MEQSSGGEGSLTRRDCQMTKLLIAQRKMKLPHWHLERLLLPSTTHTHTPDPRFHPPSVSVTAHTDGEKMWKWIYENIKIISTHRSALIPPLSNIRCQRNRCRDINFHDVRNLGGGVAGKSSVVADYSCLCVFVCFRLTFTTSTISSSSSSQTAWELV